MSKTFMKTVLLAACLVVVAVAGDTLAVASDSPGFDLPQFTLSASDIQQDAMPTPQADGDAEDAGGDASNTDLAKQTQNPIADLINVPFQSNIYPDAGIDNDLMWIMNFQPVIPMDINDDWLLINRFIVPVTYAPEFAPGQGTDFGLGDLQYTAFFSPKDESKLTWGVGPVFRFPTATDTRLGSDKWSIGPSVVALVTDGPWVIGGLAQHVWSVAGTSSREDVSELLVQPFVNYNLSDGWYLVTAPIITANWKAPSSNQWTVPVGGGLGRVFKIGKLPINMQLQGFYHVEAPDTLGDWSMRFQFAFLFPKG